MFPKIHHDLAFILYLKLPPNWNLFGDHFVGKEELGGAREDVLHALDGRRCLAVLLVVMMDSAEKY